MSNKFQRVMNFWKFPTSGILVGLLFLVFFSALCFQLANTFLDSREISTPPTKVSATDPVNIPGKIAYLLMEEAEEKEEENQEEKSSKHFLGTEGIPFQFHVSKPFLISKTFFNLKIVFYHKVSLYILFQSLLLDLS